MQCTHPLPPRCEVQERPRDGGRLVTLVKALWQRGVTESHDGQDGKADEPDDTGATMMPELLGAERDGRATLDELEGDAEEIELDELEFSSELHLPDEPGVEAQLVHHVRLYRPGELGVDHLIGEPSEV